MNITLSLLRSLDACAEHRHAFAAAFPDGLTVTGEPDADAITKIVGAKLNVDWLCVRVLTKPAYDEAIAIVDAAYRKAVAPTYAAYDEALTTAAWRFLADDENIKSEYRGRS